MQISPYLFGMPADAAIRVGLPLFSGGLSVGAFMAAAAGRPKASQMLLAAATLVGTFWAFAEGLRREGPAPLAERRLLSV